MHKIKLLEDFGNDKNGDVITVTSTKLKRIQSNKIKYVNRIVAGTGTAVYHFEKPIKATTEEE